MTGTGGIRILEVAGLPTSGRFFRKEDSFGYIISSQLHTKGLIHGWANLDTYVRKLRNLHK